MPELGEIGGTMFTKQELIEVNERLKTLNIKGKDYAPVTERVKAFREICPTGTISTEILSMEDGVVVMKATVSDGDLVLGTGLAYEKETSSYINKTSYVENCETSAVGRALGFCGIGIDASMASAEELANALKQQEEIKAAKIGKVRAGILENMLNNAGVDIEKLKGQKGVSDLADLTEEQHAAIVRRLK